MGIIETRGVVAKPAIEQRRTNNREPEVTVRNPYGCRCGTPVDLQIGDPGVCPKGRSSLKKAGYDKTPNGSPFGVLC